MKIFSGDASIKMWDEINNAKTIDDIKDALYSMACKMQELEAVVNGLKDTK